MLDIPALDLAGRKGIVIGIANDQSITYGCARAFRTLGAEPRGHLPERQARRFVEPLAQALEADIFLPCNVQADGEMEMVFANIRRRWGRLDFALHCIAFAPMYDLHGRIVDRSRDGFMMAMDVSCHSFIRLCHLAEPLMTEGDTLFTMSYYGADKVIEHNNVIGPVKAALESATRYLAAELGPKAIRVHAVSPGPLKTRAASGIEHFDELMAKVAARAPARTLVSTEDVGITTALMATGAGPMLTGTTTYADGGYHVMG